MPPKKVTLPAFTKMEARVEALESEISEVRSTLVEVQNPVTTNQTNLIAMLEKCLGKSLMVDEGDAGVYFKGSSAVTGNGYPHNTVVNSLRGDALTEYCQFIK